MKVFTIKKATHKFFGAGGTPAIAVAQKRGDSLMINRLENGKVVERARAVGTCAGHLTGYGYGIAPREALSVDSMQGAWRYMFGVDAPLPLWCEVHTDA